MGLLLGILTGYYTWRPEYTVDDGDSLRSACLVGSLYWITQITSILYPGTSLGDPPYTDKPQPIICAIVGVVVLLAYWLERKRFVSTEQAKVKTR